MKLPHGRELLEILPLSDLYSEFSEHERLTVFANKGRDCVTCPRVGTLLVLSKETGIKKESRKRGSVGRIHIDLYTDDFVLMTVDHIMPKYQARKLGWGKLAIESLDNKQPMCDPCNNSKGCKDVSNETLSQWRQNANNQPIMGIEVLRQLVTNIHVMNGDYNIIGENK